MTANEGEQQGDTVEASLAALYSGVLAEAKPPRFSISPPPDALPAVDLSVPLLAEAGQGAHWAAAH